MAKKVAGYIIFGIFVIAVLIGVYFFMTKGYSGKGINIAPILQNPSSTNTNPTGANQEIGSVASDKISLVVTSPVNGAALDSTNVTVKGKTSPNADVFVNDQAGKADANGNFSISIGLDEGSNLISVAVNDAEGNATTQELTVTIASF